MAYLDWFPGNIIPVCRHLPWAWLKTLSLLNQVQAQVAQKNGAMMSIVPTLQRVCLGRILGYYRDSAGVSHGIIP